MFANLTPTDWLEAIVLFVVSFLLGLWLGWLLWGRFKRLYLELEEKYNGSLRELNDWKAKFTDMEARHRDLDFKFKDLNTRHGDLETQYDRSLSKVKEQDGMMVSLRERIEQTQGKVTVLEGFQVKYNELLPAYEADRQRIADLQMKINNMDVQRGELNELITSLRPFRTRFEELQVQYGQLKSEKEEWLTIQQDLERTAQADLKAYGVVQQELDELKVVKSDLERTAQADLKAYGAVQQELHELKIVKNDLERTAQADLKAYGAVQQELHELKIVKNDLERTAQADLKYVAQLQKQLEESKAEREQLEAAKLELERSTSSGHTQLTELQQQLDASNQELEALRKAKAELEQNAHTGSQQSQELEQQLAAARKELEALQTIKSDLERTAQADLKMVAGLEHRLHQTQVELKELRGIYQELQRTAQADLSYVSRLESQISELKAGASTSAPILATPETTAIVDEAWKEEEAALLADPRLAKIRARASEMNFDRIGLAAPGVRDDLKLIKGIGPFIEKKLNALNIYTFQQISNFTSEDVDKVTEVIAFFPGRIERDEWVRQAADFVKNGVPTTSIKPNDLKIVEGIGPKIESLLHQGGIKTWAALAEAPVSRLQEILDAAGDRYRIHDPSTWPQQATLADNGNWKELEILQEELIGGRKS